MNPITIDMNKMHETVVKGWQAVSIEEFDDKISHVSVTWGSVPGGWRSRTSYTPAIYRSTHSATWEDLKLDEEAAWLTDVARPTLQSPAMTDTRTPCEFAVVWPVMSVPS
jgi:hypothetical protein